jgi:hypothetical protein
LHGLRKQALIEVNAAADLRPEDPEAHRLQRLLRRAVAISSHQEPEAAPQPVAGLPASLPPVDISQESMTAFIGQVQPILMNACASCHATNRGGEFKLMRSYHGAMLNQRATQYNLSAVMAQIDVNRPRISPLLVKAISSHGHTNQAPLRGRQTPAFQHLEEWVETTLADNPQLVEEPARVSATRAAPEAGAKPPSEPVKPPEVARSGESLRPPVPADAQEQPANQVVAMSSPPNGAIITGQGPMPRVENKGMGDKAVTVPSTPLPKPPPPKPAAPADEFSGEIFNQQWHADRSQ